jgi:hypothetical protein
MKLPRRTFLQLVGIASSEKHSTISPSLDVMPLPSSAHFDAVHDFRKLDAAVGLLSIEEAQ